MPMKTIPLSTSEKVMQIENKILSLLDEAGKKFWYNEDKAWLMRFGEKYNTIRYWNITKNTPIDGKLVSERKSFFVYLVKRKDYTGGRYASYRETLRIYLVPKNSEKKEC